MNKARLSIGFLAFCCVFLFGYFSNPHEESTSFQYGDRVLVIDPQSFYFGFSGRVHHISENYGMFSNTIQYVVILNKDKKKELIREENGFELQITQEFSPNHLTMIKEE